MHIWHKRKTSRLVHNACGRDCGLILRRSKRSKTSRSKRNLPVGQPDLRRLILCSGSRLVPTACVRDCGLTWLSGNLLIRHVYPRDCSGNPTKLCIHLSPH